MYGNYVEERNRKTVARVRASEPVQMPELRDHSRAIGLVAKFNAAHRRRCAERRAFYEKFVRRSIPSPPELKPGTSAAELSEEWMSDLIALFPSAPVSQRSSFQRRRSSMAPSVQQSSFFGRRFSISPSSPRTSRRFSTMRLRSSIREITEEDIATQAKAEQRMVENNFQLWKTHTLIHRFMARHMELDRVRRKDILCRVLIKGYPPPPLCSLFRHLSCLSMQGALSAIRDFCSDSSQTRTRILAFINRLHVICMANDCLSVG